MRSTAHARRIPAVKYPETDRMGEHELQRLIAELLRPLLARYLASRAKVAHVGADTFIYWVEGEPGKRLAPDVYVLPSVEQDIVVPSWRLWEIGVVPSFALEVVSSDALKDYEEAPIAYAEMGVKELVVFDPDARIDSGRRVRWQVFRQVKKRGLVRVEVSQGDRIASKSLGCFLRMVGSGASLRVRLGTGSEGDELFPTEVEAQKEAREAEQKAREAEQKAREAEQKAREAEQKAREVERKAKEAALTRVAELEEELRVLRRKR